MKQIVLLIIFICLSIIGCTSTKNFHIEPEYQDTKKPTSVLILPIQREWFQNHYPYTFGNLSGTAKDVFWSSLGKLFSENLNSSVELANPNASLNQNLFEPTPILFSSGQEQILVPSLSEEVDFEINGASPHMVLLLDKYFYRKKREVVGGNSYAGHEGKEKNFLYFEIKYVYWDTRNQKIAAWGSTDASVRIGSDITQPDYLEVLSKAVQKITERGPVI